MTDSRHFDPHGTTILAVRRNGAVALGGDGQVTLGNTVMKGNARKVRKLYNDKVMAGFAGGTADAFTLFERFEGKLEKYGNLTRAAIELAKDWRSDRYLRRLEALLLVGDPDKLLVISGNGDVIEPESMPPPSAPAGRSRWPRRGRCWRRRSSMRAASRSASLNIAADICIYTNRNLIIEELVSYTCRHHVSADPPRDRPGARQAHHRPARRQARGGHRAAQPLAAHAGRRSRCGRKSRRRTSS